MNATSSSVRLGAMDLYHPLPCPDGWTTRRLRFVTRINKAQPITLAPVDEVSFVPMAAIGEHGGIQLDQVKALDEIGDGYTYFSDGDVVVAKITPCFENGKGAFAEGLKNGIAFGTTELHVIRPAEEIDGRFLFYLSISELFRKLGEGAMYGAGGQKRVPELFIKDFQALLPPPDQQQKIAAFLDRKTAEIDTLIAKKRRLLDRLAEKRTALITRAVTKGLNPDAPMKDSGIEWLGEIPAHWELWKVTHHFRTIGSGATPPSGDPVYYDGDINWVTTSELRECGITSTKIKVTEKAFNDISSLRVYVAESIVIAMYGATIGRLGWLEQPATVNQACCVFSESNIMKQRYLYYWLFAARSILISFSYGGGQPNLSQEYLRSLRTTLPPLSEQEEIIQHIDENIDHIEGAEAKIKGAINRLEEYRSALITNAVTGQIKVA